MLFFADSGRGRSHTGGVDGIGRHGRRLDAAPDRVPRQPVPQGRRRRPAVAMERTLRIVDEALQAVDDASSCPATPRNPSRDRCAAGGTGSRSAPRSCSRSRRSRRRGAAIRRPAGTASRRRRPAASTRPGSTPLVPGLANAQQQVDVATFMQWVDAYARGETELGTSTAALPGGVQARVQRVGRDEAAQDQGAPADAVRDAAVPAGGQGGSRPAGPERRGARGAGARRTSSGRRTTCSASSCSRSRSSSRG